MPCVVVQSLNYIQLFETSWTAACQASLSFIISLSLFKHMFIESMMPSRHLILCHPLLLLPSIFPCIRIFLMSRLFTSVGESIEALASASVLPMNIQGWFPLGLTGLISLLSKGLSRVFSNTTVQSIISLALSFLYGPTLTSLNDYWKNHSFDFVGKVISLLFNMLSRFVLTFLPRSCLVGYYKAILHVCNWNSRRRREMFEEMMLKHFQIWLKKIIPQIQAAQKTTSRKKIWSKHMTVKLLKTQERGNIKSSWDTERESTAIKLIYWTFCVSLGPCVYLVTVIEW